jgi:O-methyltransferase
MVKGFIRLIFRSIFNFIGYDIVFFKKKTMSIVAVDKNIWEPYFLNDSSMQLYFEGIKHSKNEKSDNFYKQLRFYSLQEAVNYVMHRRLKGDFVECGAFKGHSAYIISKIISKKEFDGRFHIFDSFEGGLSKKVEKDKNIRVKLSTNDIMEEARSFSSSEIEVSYCLEDFEFIHLYKGWIPNRFYEVENRIFSFVHIDVDLYKPTLDSLNFFFPRLVSGGIIVCDDYGAVQFPGAKKAVDEFLIGKEFTLFYRVPMGGCFLIK